MSASAICYGEVIKLWTKSAHTESEGGCLGFLEQKNQLLLVVPPTTNNEKFTEAEFIVAPVRGEKQPKAGTPLNYRQPFVLRTSDGSGYSLNNKTPNLNDSVSLQPVAIKGELYVSIEKEGYTSETHVHDGDMNVEINVVDSNRIRKKYNKTWSHFTKPKSDAPGGFVCCGTKGSTLTFKIIKVADKTETRQYISSPVIRRASQELLDPVKADDVSEASVVETPRSSIVGMGAILTGSNAPSRVGSIAVVGPIIPENEVIDAEPLTTETIPVVADTPTTTEAQISEVVEPVVIETVVEQPTVLPTQDHVEHHVDTVSTQPQSLPSELIDTSNVEHPAPVSVDSGLATIELSAIPVDMEGMNKSTPVVRKVPTQQSEVTVSSALDVHSEIRRSPTEIELDGSPISCIGDKFKGCVIL